MHDRRESMRNDEHGRVCKTLLDRLRNLGVHLEIDRRGRFVHHEDFGVLQERSSKTEKLPLALAEVCAFCRISSMSVLLQARDLPMAT